METPETKLKPEPPVHSSDLVRRLLANQPSFGRREIHNINRALDAGAAYGYGNVMAWLATEWAVKLRDEHGLSEQSAIAAVSNRTPYALPPNTERSHGD